MRKCYLLVYGPSVASYQQMKAVMNTIPEVKTWRTDIPNCFYVVSETDATTLAKAAESGFREVAAKAEAGNFEEADAALKQASTTCAGCHKVHREKVESGWKIK